MGDYQSSPLRPTLPPLHSLDLPSTSLGEKTRLVKFNNANGSYNCPMSTRAHVNPRIRQPPIPPSTKSGSSTTPPPSDFSISTGLFTSGHHNSLPTAGAPRYRLVRSSFEDADAILIVPSPLTPYVPPSSPATPANISPKGQGLLLVGSAMHQCLRHPQRNIARGARTHPYRIVKVDTSKTLTSPLPLQ